MEQTVIKCTDMKKTEEGIINVWPIRHLSGLSKYEVRYLNQIFWGKTVNGIIGGIHQLIDEFYVNE